MSLALKFKQKILGHNVKQKAQRLINAGVTTAATPAQNAAFATLKESLSADLTTLKYANGDAERDPFKIELIEKYRAYAQEMMEYSNWAGQKVIFYWLLWRLDIEGLEAVQSDLYRAVQRGLTTPVEFKRDWQTLYIDTVYKYSNEAFKAKKDFVYDYLEQVVSSLNTGEIVTNAPLKSKVFALMGKIEFSAQAFEKAIKYFQAALNLDKEARIKKLLKQAQEHIKKDETNEQSN